MKSHNRQAATGITDIEHVSRSWSKYTLWGAWVALFILSSAVNLQNSVVAVYTNYATSSFHEFSLLATVQVVQGVLHVATRPPLASVSDYIGRFEGYLLSSVSFTIGASMLAASRNIGTYFGAQIFYMVGRVGLHFMGVVFALDTSDLVHRALFISLPDSTKGVVPWLTAPVTTGMLKHSSWQWGIGMWAVIVPACCVPLLTIMWVARYKSRKMRVRERVPWKVMLEQMDPGGNFLLAGALALIFVAIPLASGTKSHEGWGSPHIIVMLVLGVLCAVGFFVYEYYVPKYPLLPYRLFNRQLCKCFVFIVLHSFALNTYNLYYFSWLRVTFNYDNSAAANINVVYTVTNAVSSLVAALCLKYIKKVKWFIVVGVAVHLLGLGLQYYYRTPNSSTVQLVFTQIISGLGDGLMTIPNQIFVQSFCQHAETAQVTALYLAFLSLGHVSGDALAGSLYRSKYIKYLSRNVPGHGESFYNDIANVYTKALKYPMGSDTRNGIIAAYGELMTLLFTIPMALYGVMLLISLTYVDTDLGQVDDGVRGVVFGAGMKEEHTEEVEVEVEVGYKGIE